METLLELLTTFSLIFLAEIGDKSQLVTMTLAARYRTLPVVLGALSAFIILNTLAVLFGAVVAEWIPQGYLYTVVGVLFGVFGWHALQYEEEEDEEEALKPMHYLYFGTLLLITLAEFGDKTQLAVVGLSTTSDLWAVWIGATLALSATTLLGVFAGRVLLQRIPLRMLHTISGAIFMLLAAVALYKAALLFLGETA